MGKEDDHSDLREEEHDVARLNPPEEGRPECDSHRDLSDHDGDAQPVEDLRGDLGHDEHQGQIEEKPTEVEVPRCGGEERVHVVRLEANCVGSMSDVCMSCRFTWTPTGANGQT